MADLRTLLTGDPAKDKMITTQIKASEQGFVHTQIAPRVGVSKRNGAIGVIKRSDKIQSTKKRADNVEAESIAGIKFVDQTYNTQSIDRYTFLTVDQLDHSKYNAEAVRMAHSEALTEQLLLIKEYEFNTLITNANKYRAANKETLTGSEQFNHTDAKPINTLIDKGFLFKKATGVYLDTICFSESSWAEFLKNPDTASRLPDSFFKAPKIEDVLSLLRFGSLVNLKEIIIAGATYDKNATKEAVDRDYIWSDDVLLFKKAKEITPETNEQRAIIEAGLVLDIQSEDPHDFGVFNTIDKKLKGERQELRMRYDFLNCGSDDGYFEYGYLLKDTNA